MSFLNPIWLWGLTALAVPVAIHLLSRKEGKVIRIGSLRHLTESTSQQFKSLRLNELLLLALRALIILLIVLLLSGLRLDVNTTNRWVLVDPRLKENANVQRISDSLTARGFILKSWSHGFPGDTQSINEHDNNHWQLVERLRKEPVSEAVILSTSRLVDFKGEPQALPANIHWFQVDEPAQSFIQSARRTPDGELLLRKGTTSSQMTSFVSEKIQVVTVNDSLEIKPIDTIHVFLQADENFLYDRDILVASLQSIEKSAEVIIPVHFNSNPTDSVWNIWLSEKPAPQFKGPSIVFVEKPNAALLESVSAERWIMTQRLHAENAIESHISLQLAQLLLDRNDNSNTLADLRSLPEEMRWIGADEKTVSVPARASIDTWLLLLLTSTFLLERILSNKKRA